MEPNICILRKLTLIHSQVIPKKDNPQQGFVNQLKKHLVKLHLILWSSNTNKIHGNLVCSYMTWECDSIGSKHHRSADSRYLNYAASLPGEMMSSKMMRGCYQCIETIYSSSFLICEWPVSALVRLCYHYTACQND